MKRTITAVAIAVMFTLPVIAFASPGCGSGSCSDDKHPAAKKTTESAICPVMGSKIPDISKVSGKSVYKGKTYYFCCDGCKPKFDKEPEKYVGKSEVKKAEPGVCPVTGAKKSNAIICPVTGKVIADISKAPKSVYKGTTYYFCSVGSKKAFDKNPAKYVKAKKPQSAVCPVMGSKIPDVSKAAGKSVYKGKTYYFCCAGCKPKFDKDPEKYIKK